MAVNQISIFLENRNGMLAELTRLLAENKVNLRAISIAETSDYGVLRIIADDCERAISILREKGNIVSVTPVTVVAVPDKPAGLSEILELLACADVAVEYMYSLFVHKDEKAYMVFRVAEEEKFHSLLKAHGLLAAENEELGLR